MSVITTDQHVETLREIAKELRADADLLLDWDYTDGDATKAEAMFAVANVIERVLSRVDGS